MPTRDAQIASLAVTKMAVHYLAQTTPQGTALEPGALRTTSSVVRNVYLAMAEELDFIPPAPAPAVAAARQISDGVDFAGEGKFSDLLIQIREFDSKGQQTASNGTPYLRFVSSKGQWWTLWNADNIAVAQTAGVCDQFGNGGWISCSGSVGGKFTNINKAEILTAGGGI